MVKTTNENKVQYVAPKMKVFQVRPESALLGTSFGDSTTDSLEGDEGPSYF